METSLKCPHCSSDWILPKSNQEEFNPNHEVFVCTQCMCHFKKDGTILQEGRKFEPYKPHRKKSKRRNRRTSRTRKNASKR